ncbi:hypothetical protein LOD99_7072 [Oopsacas minuta]|uniref:Uncharacterized protein n=1 Tax=Oopsacas minuta TaxID=111878 RepID=A0AAV7JIV6_9METZ|nr:hypothetical protein LOD99_7072 [Oopsacas minuta]
MLSKRGKQITLILTLTILAGLIIYKLSAISSQKISILKSFKTGKEEEEAEKVSICSFNQSWIDYRNNWDGTILIEIQGKQILLTDEYVEAMICKGQHPLTRLSQVFGA